MTLTKRLGWSAGLAILGVVWLGSGTRDTAGSSSVEAPIAEAHVADRTVQVTHQLISVEVVREPLFRVRTQTPVTRSATRRIQERHGTAERAMRLLLGDGRHRPEPFPTVDRQPK